jgi:hypothetical protein
VSAGLEHFGAALDNAAICHSVARGGKRDVQDAATNEWAAVGDANDYGPVGCQIRNANSRAEWEAAMCGG